MRAQRGNVQIEVARGNVLGRTYVNKFGFNASIENAATYEDIWDGGSTTDWAPPTTARIHNLKSTSGNDDLTGSGAEKVQVVGLDSAYAEQEEEVTLNGTEDVPTANSYTMIYRMYVTQSANGANTGFNAGVITATAVTDGTVTAQINAGNNQTLMAVYQIPAGKTGMMNRWYASLAGKTTANVIVRLWAKGDGAPWQLKDIDALVGAGSSRHERRWRTPNPFAAKTILKIDASSDTNSTSVAAGFDLEILGN